MMNLTPEQLEFLFYLLGALIIGFFFGYLLAKSFARSRYEVEIEELSDLLDTRDREIESASAKHGQLKQHMAVQANEIKEANQKIVDAQEVISKFENSSKLLNDEKSEFETLLARKELEVSELNDKIDSIRDELEEHKNTNTNHEQKLIIANKEIEQNVKLSQAFAKKSEERSTVIKELEKDKNILNEKVHMLTKSIKDTEHIADELKQQSTMIGELKQENDSLKEKLSYVSKLLDESRVETEKLEVKTANIENKDENYTILQKALEESRNDLAQKDAEIINLEKKLSGLETQTKKVLNQEDVVSVELKQELQQIKDDLARKDNVLKLTEDKLRLAQEESKKLHRKLQGNALNEKAISQLSGNDNSKGSWGLSKIVKNVFGSK